MSVTKHWYQTCHWLNLHRHTKKSVDTFQERHRVEWAHATWSDPPARPTAGMRRCGAVNQFVQPAKNLREISFVCKYTVSNVVHQTQQAFPPVAQWDQRPATCCWMTVKSRRPDQNPSKAKKQDYFKGVFFWIISLYCIVILVLAKFVSTPQWK